MKTYRTTTTTKTSEAIGTWAKWTQVVCTIIRMFI